MAAPELGAGPLRFAILDDGSGLAEWQLSCLEELARKSTARPVVRLAARSAGALPEVYGALPTLVLDPALPAARAPGPAHVSLGARLREYDLDFILCFADGAMPVELLDLPRHGVWRFHLGDWVNYRPGPGAGGAGADAASGRAAGAGGFWEVYEGAAASAALLIRVHADPELAVVLREGFLRTRLLSVAANRAQLLDRMVAWPAAVCRQLARPPGAAGSSPAPLRARTALRRRPSARHRLVLAARIAVRIAMTAFRALFRHDQWNIGIIDRPLHSMLESRVATEVAWLPATPRAELRADPFGIVRDGRATVFCEYFSYREQRGYIVAMDPLQPATSTRVQIGPQPPVHLSYPFLLEVDGQLCCMPESSAAQEVGLYALQHFPDQWRRSATLIAGRGVADATMFVHEGRWWLAASEVADKGANSELHLWFAEAPQGPWTPHPGNPVKIDVRSARPAGAPFVVEGVLYRPAQDCSSTYGARVIINRVLNLTPEEFREEPAAELNPDPRGAYPDGLHTLSALGERTLIDGKRSIFVAAEFWRVLRHYLP